MRIYCDSNIFRKAKSTSNQFNKEVYDTMESLRGICLFLFSEAHLDDLSKSNEYYRNEDLTLMEQYVNNNYICRDHIYKKINFLLATPTEAYNSHDFAAQENYLKDPVDYINNLLNTEDNEYLNLIKPLFDIPILDLSEFNIENLPEDLKNKLGNIEDIKTLSDIIKLLPNFGFSLTDPKAFRNHQKHLASFIDRDSYSYDKCLFDFDQKMKETGFQKSFMDLVDMIASGSDKDDLYTNFINTYVGLETFGVTEEKTGKKRKVKANSYMDLYHDAAHAFFASFTDYFITDDKGVQVKSFITYKLLGIKTQVLSSKDFIGRACLLLKNEDDLNSFKLGLKHSLKTGLVVDNYIFSKRQIVQSLYPFFNYFDRVQVELDEMTIQLFRSRDNRNGIMYAELQLLIDKCTKAFGSSNEIINRESLTELSKYEKGQIIRSWGDKSNLIQISWEVNSFDEEIIVLGLKF